MRQARLALSAGLLTLAVPVFAQDWSPPSRAMPEIPARSALRDLASWAGKWLPASAPLQTLRAEGEGDALRLRSVRLIDGNRPAARWTDRNGDGRADMIEIYRSGALAYQLIDPDHDGVANVFRMYDESGRLAREERR